MRVGRDRRTALRTTPPAVAMGRLTPLRPFSHDPMTASQKIANKTHHGNILTRRAAANAHRVSADETQGRRRVHPGCAPPSGARDGRKLLNCLPKLKI